MKSLQRHLSDQLENKLSAEGTLAFNRETGADLLASRHDSKSLHTDRQVKEWVDKQLSASRLQVQLVPLHNLEQWHTDPGTGNIRHQSGRFFTVTGVKVRHRSAAGELEWDQPVIDQPEVGILGILAKRIDGVFHFCLQAKEEPGNIGGVQLSPTVQATYSNYTGAHGGATTRFLEHFMDPPAERIIFARMQTEDGGRFLYKSNRNMIVDAGNDFPVDLPDDFIWLSLRQIAALMQQDNLVNACTRSILSSLAFAGSAVGSDIPQEGGAPGTTCPSGLWDTLLWIDTRRASNHMLVRRIGLNELEEWGLDEKGFFSHREKRFFRIVGMKISAAAREVRSWCQPIIENPAPGVIGLLVRNGAQGLEILMQAKAEVGNKVTVQLGPTVQFTQGNYADSNKLKKPFLFEEFLVPNAFRTIHESRQAEEGARFYRECHFHRILMLPDGAELPLPDDYRWLPLSHVMFLVHLGEQVNSCARSILTCLL